MADVSVWSAMTNDSEVMLNLSLPQVLRLMEATARKAGETMSTRTGSTVGPSATASNGMPNLGPFTAS